MKQCIKNLDFIEKEAFHAIQRIFPCEDDLLDEIPIDRIIHHFKKDIQQSEHPFLIRAVGQSGSGKSSQLIPALQEALISRKYIRISVGDFAVFHPKYEFFKKTDPHKLREKTNGFALRALVIFYKYCILNRVNVVLDMTLLEPEIDIYLMGLAKQMSYQIQMHLLCVPKKISDLFISLRQKETGRYVQPSSCTYFFSALAPCLKALIRSSLFCKQDRLFLWSHYLQDPLSQTHLNNPYALCILQKYQGKYLGVKKYQKFLKAKKRWMKLFVESLNV